MGGDLTSCPESSLRSRSRKIPFILVCAGAVAAALWPADAGAAPQRGSASAAPASRLSSVDLSQSGRKLVVALRSRAPIALAGLDRLPATRDEKARYLCVALRRVGRRGERWLCLGARRTRVGVLLVNARRRVVDRTLLAARLRRPKPRTLVLALNPAPAGLRPGRYRWRAEWRHGACADCAERLPADGAGVFRLRPVRAVGCTGGGAGVIRGGPSDGRVVALTFDDGPSAYTEGFLRVLREKRVRGTFAVLGQEIPGRESILRRALRAGHEIVNHSTHHAFYPGYDDLVATNALIFRATHFRPCLFRPPGGAVNEGVVSAAARAGMRTLLWDVDPADWTNPGSAAIHSRVVGAVRPGSIVVMHDGGGSRGQTLAALPSIIETLRRRGYRFATVSALLGERIIYRPYG